MSKWLARLKHTPQEATPDQVPEVPEVRLTVIECRHCGARYWHHLGHLAEGGKIAGGPCCFGHPVLTVSKYPTEAKAQAAWGKWQGATITEHSKGRYRRNGAAMMYDCPKFHTCSANICPLDPEWKKRTHIKGERVCMLLCEAVKPHASDAFRGVHREDLLTVIEAVLPEICSRWGSIRRTVERAKKTGSRMKPPGQK